MFSYIPSRLFLESLNLIPPKPQFFSAPSNYLSSSNFKFTLTFFFLFSFFFYSLFTLSQSIDMFTSSTPTSLRTPILHHPLPSSPFRTNFSPITLPPFHRTLSFLPPPPLLPAVPAISTAAKADKSGEQKWVHEGLIMESLPNGMFRVRLDNEDLILGYISGKIRKNYVRILPGDRVKVEVSRYDSSKGRIVYRLRSSTPS